MAELPVPGVEESQPRGRRFWSYRTLHGWIVAVAALDNDDGPTFVTERGAKDWAERLNTRAALAESPSPGPEERAAEIGWDGASCSHCRSSECDGIGCGPGPGA